MNNEGDFFAWMGLPYPYNRPKSQWKKDADESKIIVLSDLHEEYSNPKVLHEVEAQQKDAGMLFCPGDVGDYYSRSRFRKSRGGDFSREVRAIFLRLEWMSTHWKDVRVMLGNHDNRPEKQLQDLLSNHPELLIMTESNLLAKLASYFDNVKIVGTQLTSDQMIDGRYHKINLTHIHQLGDIVFTHGEKSSVQKTAVMSGISQWLFRWKNHIGLKPYTIIAQGHNHADLKMTMGDERWFMIPTASDLYSLGLEYIFTSRMIGDPPAVGYSVFFQEGGITDYNRSGNIVL